jgi:cell division protein FtsB
MAINANADIASRVFLRCAASACLLAIGWAGAQVPALLRSEAQATRLFISQEMQYTRWLLYSESYQTRTAMVAQVAGVRKDLNARAHEATAAMAEMAKLRTDAQPLLVNSASLVKASTPFILGNLGASKVAVGQVALLAKQSRPDLQAVAANTKVFTTGVALMMPDLQATAAETRKTAANLQVVTRRMASPWAVVVNAVKKVVGFIF